MRLRREPAIQIKTPAQIARMYAAGQVVARTLAALADAVRPGVTTAELDSIAEREIRAADAVPSFLGYSGYPASICASVNQQVVHGIPSDRQRLRAGDIISVDCGAILDGWHADAAISVGVGEIDPADQALLDACEASMWAGIAQAVPGRRLGDISNAVERSVRGSGHYGLIREYTGHGIGTEMHMDPAVRNYGPPGQGPRLLTGMALAIEPMITRGGREVAELDDGWTVVSVDGSRAAHFEHTIAITAGRPWVLTALEGAQSASAERAGVRLSRPDAPPDTAVGLRDDDRLATRTAPGGDGDVG
jgi:methionyl aminopeptidase